MPNYNPAELFSQLGSYSFQVDYLDHVYSRDQILNIINLAGFGLGIGSGRTSGYGRYHITNVAA